MTAATSIEALGDRAILIRLDERIDVDLNQRVHALAGRLSGLPGVAEVVPAYASVAVLLQPGAWFDDSWRTRIEALLSPPGRRARSTSAAPEHRIVVNFDGMDLADVAGLHELEIPQLVGRLCSVTYQVAMLGFLPGFPYLLGLDPALALPRRAQPRARVPANSLALGGSQLGIYPCAAPGGWHLLGSLTESLFDPQRAPAALLNPGDRVQFVPA